MPNTPLRDIDVVRLLHRARVHFDNNGRIPTDIAAKLMARGIIVHRLEDQWSRA